jgi:LacI family transcriptional regulator
VSEDKSQLKVNPVRRVTLRDLARELGVSDRAVSQALNPRSSNVKLNPKTVERIQKLARQKNYLPDSRARSMRYGRFYNIGYFEAKKTSRAWPLLGAESGIYDAASENRYNITLIRLPSDLAEHRSAIPNAFREGHLDALVLSHTGNLNPQVEDVIDSSGFPVVYLNEKKPLNAVYANDRQGSEDITTYLISQGHRHLVYVVNIDMESHYSGKDRVLGYEQAMMKAGLKPQILNCHHDPIGWDENLKAMLDRYEKIDAIVSYSDFSALGIFRVLYANSIQVPKDLSVTGFGDDFGLQCSPVRLTTMKTPFYQMGRASVEMALELINSNEKTVPSRVFPVELIVRDSTRSRD